MDREAVDSSRAGRVDGKARPEQPRINFMAAVPRDASKHNALGGRKTGARPAWEEKNL